MDYRLHDLRHFYASGLINGRCDVVTVQRALGHASAAETLKTYAQLWPDASDRTRLAARRHFAVEQCQNLVGDEPDTVFLTDCQSRTPSSSAHAAARERSPPMNDDAVRAALQAHWAASDANDFDAEHRIYRTDAVLEYPQSRERIRGRDNIQASRSAQPNAKRFTVRRILGGGNLWVSELVLTYDGQPFYVVSIMEFEDGEVVRETQYFGDAFEPGPSRAQWVERME